MFLFMKGRMNERNSFILLFVFIFFFGIFSCFVFCSIFLSFVVFSCFLACFSCLFPSFTHISLLFSTFLLLFTLLVERLNLFLAIVTTLIQIPDIYAWTGYAYLTFFQVARAIRLIASWKFLRVLAVRKHSKFHMNFIIIF